MENQKLQPGLTILSDPQGASFIPHPFFSFIPLPVQNKYKMSDAII